MRKITVLAAFLILLCSLLLLRPAPQVWAQGNGPVVILFIDQKFYQDLETEILRLADDIATDLSTSTILEIINVDQTTPEDIRAIIQSHYRNNGLLGSVLIGDIPSVSIGDYLSLPSIPTDTFYEDLDDALWVDPDGNGIYNKVLDEDGDGEYDWFYITWTAEHNREVWSGRLLPPRSVSLTDRIELLRNYLDRNHQYRTGEKTYQRGMVYAESVRHNGDPSDGEDDYDTVLNRAVTMMDESWLFNRQAGDVLNFVWSDDLSEHMNQWLNGVHNNYEYGLLSVHGSVDGQWFGSSASLSSTSYQITPANTLLVDLASCNNGDFTYDDYLGGWVLFGGDALAVMANTTSVFYSSDDAQANPDHRLLSAGLTLGELRKANVLSNNSNVLLGDPTLRLREPTDAPTVTVDKEDLVILPPEPASGLSQGYTRKSDFTLTNKGDEPVNVYHRIMSSASLDGRRPWGNSFQSSFYIQNHLQIFPLTLTSGESRTIDVDFYYDGQSGAGTYRASLALYTDSSTTPYLWINMEKTLYEAQKTFLPFIIKNN